MCKYKIKHRIPIKMINLVAFVITVVTTLLVVSFVVTISIFEDAVSTYSAFVGGAERFY